MFASEDREALSLAGAGTHFGRLLQRLAEGGGEAVGLGRETNLEERAIHAR